MCSGNARTGEELSDDPEDAAALLVPALDLEDIDLLDEKFLIQRRIVRKRGRGIHRLLVRMWIYKKSSVKKTVK